MLGDCLVSRRRFTTRIDNLFLIWAGGENVSANLKISENGEFRENALFLKQSMKAQWIIMICQNKIEHIYIYFKSHFYLSDPFLLTPIFLVIHQACAYRHLHH